MEMPHGDIAGAGGCAVHLGTERRLERTPDGDRIAKPPRERGPLRWDQRSPGTSLFRPLADRVVWLTRVSPTQGTITDILEENVVQPLLVSTSAFTLATECVCMILKIVRRPRSSFAQWLAQQADTATARTGRSGAVTVIE